MKTINRSVRSDRAEDRRFGPIASAKHHAALKKISRKQFRARDRQLQIREDMPTMWAEMDEDQLEQRLQQAQAQRREAQSASALKNRSRHCAPSKKAANNVESAVSNRLLIGRPVLVRYVGFSSRQKEVEIQVVASCSVG